MGLRHFNGKLYNDYGTFNTKREAEKKAKRLRASGNLARLERAWNSKTGKFTKWQVWSRKK